MAKAMASEEHSSTPVDLVQLTWDLLADNMAVKMYLEHQETMEEIEHWPMPDNVKKVKVNKNKKKNKAKKKKAKANKEDEVMA
jgi:hypothetical protein